MQFALTQDQALIADSARAWLAAHYGFAARSASVHRDGGSPAAWSAWADLGWLALPLPEDRGGIAGGPVECGVLLQAMGRHLVVEPYVGCVLQAARLIALAGTPAQQDRWLPAVAGGRARLAFAATEAGSAWPGEPWRTTAVRQGAGWRLAGGKVAVEGAAGAAAWLVAAQEPATGRIRVLLVPPDAAGVRVDLYDTLDGARAADLQFQEVLLPDEALLGGIDGDPAAALERVQAEGLVARCWQATGALQAAFEQTAVYVQQRRQFGQALADFQVVQHRVAEMLVQCTEAQAACELAAMRLVAGAAGTSLGAIASGARNKVARAARYVAQESVQLHGAMGVCEELPIASAFRFLLAFAQREGDAEAHAAALAAELLASGAYARSQTLDACA